MAESPSTLQSPCRVLVIEDNPGDQELISQVIQASQRRFAVQCVDQLESGLTALRNQDWNVVLSDLSLPDSHGLATVRALRQHAPAIPIVVLTSDASDEIALQALDEGAQDYLCKDRLTPEVLQRSIRYAMQRQTNSEMKRLIKKLRARDSQLKLKNRRLKRLYETAHRFVDNVSHEFRTPLTVIKEYVSLVRDGIVGDLNEEQIRMLDIVCDRSGDLNNMVDDMLDISKLEAGMLGVWRRNCPLLNILNHFRPSLEKKSALKQVDIEFDIPTDLPEIYCDEEKIGRVIVNLTVNAIKFCGDPGKVCVWARHEPDQRHVVVGVTDNGSGINQRNLEVIFTRFKQFGDNRRGSGRGFGLGLNIAKELVELNLGEMNVESTPNEGSTFSFTIPVADPVEVTRRYLSHLGHDDSMEQFASMFEIKFEESEQETIARDLNAFMHLALHRNDLLLQLPGLRWLLVCPECPQRASALQEHFEKHRQEANETRPLRPLPAFSLNAMGSWKIPSESDDLVDHVHHATTVLETCHA